MPAIAHENKILGNVNTLNDLTDVNLTSPQNGQVLTIRNGEWTNEDPQAGDSIIYLTKAEYDALTPVENQMYGITDWSPEALALIKDSEVVANATWSSNKINTQLGLKANSADVPLKTQISNPNLLDNPWFTINQRGQSSYTPTHDNTYTVDRWKIENNVSGLSVTVNNDGSITLNNASLGPMYFCIANLLKDFVLDAGTKYTASINVVSYTGVTFAYVGTMNESPWTNWGELQISKTGINTISCEVPASYGGSAPTFRPLGFMLNAGATLTIKAVKLELGSISTLALDTAPNYATELLKCQRYFYRLKSFGSSDWIALGKAWATNVVNVIVDMPPMRTAPSVVISDISVILVAKGSSSLDPHRISSFNFAYFKEFGHSGVLTLNLADTTATIGETYILKSDSAVNIDFTADL